MRRLAAALLALVALTAQAPPTPSPSPSASPAFRPAPGVKDAITHHSIVLGGRRITYTARAGTLLLRDANGAPAASMFYVAYTADGVPARRRPLTFFWNGGPGSSTVWLHMGSFGPVRVAVPADGSLPRPNAGLVANESSLLDTSDLVFVDAVGTGFSTVVAYGKTSDYYGVDEDAKAFVGFIQRYLTRFGRWESPHYLFGESYGTTRAANVANLLGEANVSLNGVVLLSSALDYNLLPQRQGPGEDLVYVGYLPTYAAVAWYYRKLPGGARPDLERFLADVRAYARGPYALALRRGDRLDAATRRAVVARLHAYTGLDESYLDAANLRVSPFRFQQELLRGEGRNVGRYDARYSGFDLDRNASFPDYDPSDTTTSTVFVTNFNHYVHDVLHYRDERPYDPLSETVNESWKYQRGTDAQPPSVVADLKAAMTKNPYLHVLSANGYFDLATAFFATEFLLGHMDLPAPLRSHVHYVDFRSGHEAYLNHDALVQFKRALVQFYAASQR